MGITFVGLGLPPGMGSTHWLPSVAGPQRAAELILTGKLACPQLACPRAPRATTLKLNRGCLYCTRTVSYYDAALPGGRQCGLTELAGMTCGAGEVIDGVEAAARGLILKAVEDPLTEAL
jgi:hypothetical protein